MDWLGDLVGGFASTFVPMYKQGLENKSKQQAWGAYADQLGKILGGGQGQPTTDATLPGGTTSIVPGTPLPFVKSLPMQPLTQFQNPTVNKVSPWMIPGGVDNSFVNTFLPFYIGGSRK